METFHAVILDASGVYHGEVIGDLDTIDMNVPEGGSYEVLPPHTPVEITALLFGPPIGFIPQPPAE